MRKYFSINWIKPTILLEKENKIDTKDGRE